MIPAWFVRPIVVGDCGADVVIVQRKLCILPDGEYSLGTAEVVRGYQRVMGLEPTGVVDEETAVALGEEAAAGLLPDWYKGRDLSEGEPGWDVVVRLLEVEPHRAVDALKRFQGNNGLPVTGVVDEWTARRLGQ
jgi:peptidoglycan hydrolase-like protein with peptidoglycan-binding domain